MLKIKNVSARNFMSVGNNTQAVNFDNCQLTLVLGHNLDMGGDGSRNGTGGSDFEKIDQPPVVISNTDHQQAMEDEKKNI